MASSTWPAHIAVVADRIKEQFLLAVAKLLMAGLIIHADDFIRRGKAALRA